jgi:hypothetical protein
VRLGLADAGLVTECQIPGAAMKITPEAQAKTPMDLISSPVTRTSG